jgi:hypothetical protein
MNRCKQCSLRLIKIIFMKTGAIKVCRRQDVSKWEKWPLSILKVILLKSNTLRFLKKLEFRSITNNNGSLESERNLTQCYEKCWPNFLSEATFSRMNFWFIIFSFLLHKILALVFNMFIYAKVGHSKFVEMHGDASDFYRSALVFYTPHWVNITIYRTVYLHTDKYMCKR